MSASSRPCWVTAGIALIVIWLTIITLKLFSHDTVAVLSEEAWPEQWRAPQGEFIDYQVKPDVAVAVLVERRADDGDLGVDHDEAAAAILPEKDPLDDRGLFFVGEAGETHKGKVHANEENDKFRDIVFLDGVSDAYADLTIKVRHALKWVSEHNRALYVAKVDDDTYVNVDRFLATLLMHKPENLYFGFSMYNQGIMRTGSKNSEPKGEGYLPDSMPSTYPPYMSGGGYVLGYDLVDLVANPRVQPVKMLNEDAYLGIVLLQFNVNRVSTLEIFPNGIKGCKTGDQILLIHYVKANEYPCMVSMHRNVTTPGGKVCRSKSCGPVEHCEIKHPSKRCDKEISKKSSWTETSGTAACESNGDSRMSIARTSYQELEGFPCCKRLCEETCGCIAVDYFWDTGWCSLYDKTCTKPKTLKDGASSHQLHRFGINPTKTPLKRIIANSNARARHADAGNDDVDDDVDDVRITDKVIRSDKIIAA
eukprot:gene13168-22845_t